MKQEQKKEKPTNKLHPRSFHHEAYPMEELMKVNPALERYTITSKADRLSIDFSDARAVKELNKAILFHYYKLKSWDIPQQYLCPPIPGRADYIHYLADLLAESNKGKIPTGAKVKVLDIGTGANSIYPLLGHKIYAWDFVGTETEDKAIEAAKQNISENKLEKAIQVRKQERNWKILPGITEKGEHFDISMCNPPFHASAKEAFMANASKNKNLKIDSKNLNFGGQYSELIYRGGEIAFLEQMAQESAKMPNKCLWYTCLVSKKENVALLRKALKKTRVQTIKVIEMQQGNKRSRFVAWTFLHKGQHAEWRLNRWEDK